MEVEETLQKLYREFDENKNSHVFLVETNDIEKAIDDIKRLIVHLVSKNDSLVANQVMNETYIEMKIIRAEDNIIKNELILDLQNRLKTKPVLSDYMTYIIAPTEAMLDTISNKLLKTIEEPNANVVGFLVTRNSDLILPTIKSRCERLNFLYDDADKPITIDEEVIALTKKIVKAIENKNHLSLYEAKQDKNFKDNALTIENLLKDYYNTASKLKKPKNIDIELVNFIQNNNDYKTLLRKTKYINETLNKLSKAMNQGLLIEKMFFDLKEVR